MANSNPIDTPQGQSSTGSNYQQPPGQAKVPTSHRKCGPYSVLFNGRPNGHITLDMIFDPTQAIFIPGEDDRPDTDDGIDHARRIDDAERADEAKRADDAKRAEDAKRVEDAKRAEDARRADDANQADHGEQTDTIEVAAQRQSVDVGHQQSTATPVAKKARIAKAMPPPPAPAANPHAKSDHPKKQPAKHQAASKSSAPPLFKAAKRPGQPPVNDKERQDKTSTQESTNEPEITKSRYPTRNQRRQSGNSVELEREQSFAAQWQNPFNPGYLPSNADLSADNSYEQNLENWQVAMHASQRRWYRDTNDKIGTEVRQFAGTRRLSFVPEGAEDPQPLKWNNKKAVKGKKRAANNAAEKDNGEGGSKGVSKRQKLSNPHSAKNPDNANGKRKATSAISPPEVQRMPSPDFSDWRKNHVNPGTLDPPVNNTANASAQARQSPSKVATSSVVPQAASPDRSEPMQAEPKGNFPL